MRRKAIISLLWPSQFEAMVEFLSMHEALVVLAPPGTLTPAMQAAIVKTGASVESLQPPTEPGFMVSLAADEELHLALQTDLDSSAFVNSFKDSASCESLGSLIRRRLDADLPPALALLRCLDHAAEAFEIVLLVTNEDMTPRGRIVTAWARQRRIPSFHLSHAIPLVDPYTVHDQLFADKLAVFGKRGAEGYLDKGVAEDRIVVTGNPAWDAYADLRLRKKDIRKKLDEKYALSPALPLVVFGTTWAANLSAHCNSRIYAESLKALFDALNAMADRKIAFNVVVKDRPANLGFGEKACRDVQRLVGSSINNFVYTVEETQHLVAAADVLIAVDSNLLVEGMLADTPTINLMNVTGQLMGPCFEAETGILEVDFDGLADAIYHVMTDEKARNERLEQSRVRAAHYNHCNGDGGSARRVAEAMGAMAPGLCKRIHRYVWQQYLDVEGANLTEAYHTAGRADLASMYTNEPSFLLDIGCAAGGTAELLKQRYPGLRAWGIEMNRAAAVVAEGRLDRVLIGKFEDFDLGREGVAGGSLDAVLMADVLEHMYNPWDVMVKLRPYLATKGQVLMSIPNVRNLLLMSELGRGNWSYESAGLLDITHIRFFTFREILRLCRETGYRVISTRNSIDLRLEAFLKSHQHLALTDINMERLTLKAVTREELVELCTIQFYVLVEKDSMEKIAA